MDYLSIVLAAHDAETLGELAFRDLPLQGPGERQPEDHQTELHQPEHLSNDHHRAEDHQLEEDYSA